MNETPIGIKIREFLRAVFGSRLTAHMEDELVRVRNDYETRIHDKEMCIVDLKDEISRLRSKVAEYELVLIPLTTGGLLGPKRTASTLEPIVEPNSWRAEQGRFYREQEEAEKQETKEPA